MTHRYTNLETRRTGKTRELVLRELEHCNEVVHAACSACIQDMERFEHACADGIVDYMPAWL